MLEDAEISVYRFNYLPLIGEPVALTCVEKSSDGKVVVGEYHLILPRLDCRYEWDANRYRASDLEVLKRLEDSDRTLADSLRERAKGCVEMVYWETLIDNDWRISAAPNVQLQTGSPYDLIRFALDDECRSVLEEMRENTAVDRVSSVLDAVLSVEVIREDE